jgi:hypothetical protein
MSDFDETNDADEPELPDAVDARRGFGMARPWVLGSPGCGALLAIPALLAIFALARGSRERQSRSARSLLP